MMATEMTKLPLHVDVLDVSVQETWHCFAPPAACARTSPQEASRSFGFFFSPSLGWFINPMNTIVIGTINHSDIGVMFTNLKLSFGGPTL